jgi:hypothetical protein
MMVALDICVGFGAPLRTSDISLTALNVGQTAGYVGANHVLRLDEHFHDYVQLQNRSAFFSLPAVPGFPHQPTFTPVASKKPSADIAGTLGEGATAIVLKRLARLRAIRLVTLEVSRTAKTPDFAVRLPANWMQTAQLQVPTGIPVPPQWWPVEAKACQLAGTRMKSAAWKGFQQLVSYWRRIRTTSPNDVGFGIVVVFKYDNLVTSPPRLSAHIFLPRDQAAISTHLASKRVVSSARAIFLNGNLLHAV